MQGYQPYATPQIRLKTPRNPLPKDPQAKKTDGQGCVSRARVPLLTSHRPRLTLLCAQSSSARPWAAAWPLCSTPSTARPANETALPSQLYSEPSGLCVGQRFGRQRVRTERQHLS